MTTHPLLDTWQQLLATVSAPDARLQIFHDAAYQIGGHLGDGIATPDAVDGLLAMASAYDFFGVGEAEIERVIGEEFSSASNGEADSEADREADRETLRRMEEHDRQRERERGQGNGKTASDGEAPRSDERSPSPLPYVDLSLELVLREWLVPERIPMRNVSLISGEGSIGKSLLLMQLSGAVAVGLSWIGTRPQTGPVLYVSCEEDDDEMRRRAEDVANSLGVARRYMIERGLRILSFAGKDAILATPDRNGIIRPTPLFERIRADALQLRPKLIVLDTVADTFGGKEIDRAQTRQFITLARGLAIECDSAVVMSAHPSLTGISTDSGLSGSTGWHNSVRARMYLKRAPGDDTTLRALEIKKNNYGPVSETVLLRWRDGVYVAEGVGAPEKQAERVLERLAAEERADTLFLTILRRFAEQGRNVSDKLSSSYAPSVFADEPEAKAAKASKKALTEAMARLFAARKIRVVTFGSPSKMRSKIVEAGAGEVTGTAKILPFPTPSNGLPTQKNDLPTASQRPSDPASNGLPTPPKGCAPTPPHTPPPSLEGARGAVEGPAPSNGDKKGRRARPRGRPAARCCDHQPGRFGRAVHLLRQIRGRLSDPPAPGHRGGPPARRLRGPSMDR
jgi:RecA-family ATPase